MKLIDEYFKRKKYQEQIVVGNIDSFAFLSSKNKTIASIIVSNFTKQYATCEQCLKINSHLLVLEIFVPEENEGLVNFLHLHVHPDENILDKLSHMGEDLKIFIPENPEMELWDLFCEKLNLKTIANFEKMNSQSQMFCLMEKGFSKYIQMFNHKFNNLIYYRKNLL